MLPVWPDGGFPVGDVRDTAALHARLVDAPPAPARRFFGPGRYLSTREFVRLSEEATGRRLRVAFLPARIVLPVSAAVTLAQRVWPWPLPVAYGAVLTCACAARIGEGGDLVPARPAAETFRDAIGWLRRYGHLSATQAGTAGSGRG
jgi:nucleoside-diphosphate-sugar epimerase